MSGKMACPNCRKPMDWRAARCPECGIVYLEWLERRAWQSQVDSARPRLRRRAAPANPLFFLAALVLPALIGGAWLGRPERPLAPGSVAVPELGCAFAPPAGWEVDLAALPKDGSPAARLTDGLAVIEISMVPGSARRAALASPAAVRGFVEKQFNGVQALAEPAAELRLDGLPAWRLKVTGGPAWLPSPNAGRRPNALAQAAPSHERLLFQGAIIFVSGAAGDYLIKAWADQGYFERQGWRFEAFLNNFRVTRRPFRRDPLGALKSAIRS